MGSSFVLPSRHCGRTGLRRINVGYGVREVQRFRGAGEKGGAALSPETSGEARKNHGDSVLTSSCIEGMSVQSYSDKREGVSGTMATPRLKGRGRGIATHRSPEVRSGTSDGPMTDTQIALFKLS